MTINHDYDKTMQLLAECAARMGYKPDAMLTMPTPGGWCVKTFDATGKVFTKPDSVRSFATEINKAWGKALQQLSDMGCDVTSAMVQKPFLANITNTVGISITEKELVVGAWAVVFDGTEEWIIGKGNRIYLPESNWSARKWIAFNNNAITSKYPVKDAWSLDDFSIKEDKTVYLSNNNVDVWFLDSDYTDLTAWKQHLAELYANGTPLTVLFELATPIRIPFESPLNLTLPNLDAQDIFVLTDIDGMELSDVTVQRNGGTEAHPEFDIQIQPSQQWQQAHDGLLPPPLYLMNFGGINERIDAALILDLRRRIQALEAKQ